MYSAVLRVLAGIKYLYFVSPKKITCLLKLPLYWNHLDPIFFVIKLSCNIYFSVLYEEATGVQGNTVLVHTKKELHGLVI